MRGFSIAVSMVIGLLCAKAQAGEGVNEEARVGDADGVDDDAGLSEHAASLQSGGYNIWFCAAIRRSPFGTQGAFHFGASNPFPQGSGQGQAARAFALQQAQQGCGASCVADCYVKSFQL